jgi:hypothetical protein
LGAGHYPNIIQQDSKRIQRARNRREHFRFNSQLVTGQYSSVNGRMPVGAQQTGLASLLFGAEIDKR